MESKFNAWRQKLRGLSHIAGYIILPALVIGFIVAIGGGYIWGWDWTGVNQFFGPALKPNQQYRPEKTLWDWLQLLVVPVILWTLGTGFTRRLQRREQRIANQRAQTDRDIAQDNQREALLQEYINKMSDLLLEKRLRDTTRSEEAQKIARVRTLTVLPLLDANRKRRVLQFLYESGLLDKGKPIVDLMGADLSDADFNDADLSNVRLSGADLRRSNLSDANLRRADLNGANLRKTNFKRADLSDADLSDANLSGADLSRADLSDANLNGADLSRARLNDINLRRANLSDTSLSGADLNRAKLSDVNLNSVDLSRAKLSDANLSRANLNNVNLSDANLSRADLWNADLSDANLSRANLCKANLGETDFSGANLSGTNLSDANLVRATINQEQWEQAQSLTGAIMPDESTHP